MNQRIKNYLKSTSESENLFKYTKGGYILTKGRLQNIRIKVLYKEYGSKLEDYLEEIFIEGNHNTKLVIKDIFEHELKIKRSFIQRYFDG